MINEEEIYKTCKNIYDSNTIKTGMCLPVTALLIKYFEAKNIKTKPHLVFLENQETTVKMITHNFITYNGKKCDITANKQLIGFNTEVVILNKVISNQSDSNVKIIYLSDLKMDEDEIPPSENNIQEFITYKMMKEASESDDSSFDPLLIDEYIQSENNDFKIFIDSLNTNTKVYDIISFIKKKSEDYNIVQ